MRRTAIIGFLILLAVSASHGDPPIYSIPSGGGGLPSGGSVDQHLVNTAPGTGTWQDDANSVIENNGTPLSTTAKVTNFAGGGVNCAFSGGKNVCTIVSGGTGGSGFGSGAVFTWTANSTDTSLTPINTYIVAKGTMTLSDDTTAGAFAITSGKAEVCYTGDPTAANVFVYNKSRNTVTGTTEKFTHSIGHAAGSIGSGDNLGVVSIRGFANSVLASHRPSAIVESLSSGDCIGLLVQSTKVDTLYEVEELVFAIDVNQAYANVDTAADQTTTNAWPILSVMAESASGIRKAAAGIEVTESGGLHIRSAGETRISTISGDNARGNVRVLIGRRNPDFQLAQGVDHGRMTAQLEVISKNAGSNETLRLIPWDDALSRALTISSSDQVFDVGYWEVEGLESRLVAIGYSDGAGGDNAPGSTVGIFSDQETGNANTGMVIAASGKGAKSSGLCLTNSVLAYPTPSDLRDSVKTCLQVDPTDTATFPGGHPYIEIDDDGIYEPGNGEIKLGAGSSIEKMHLMVVLEAPQLGRWNDVEYVSRQFTLGTIRCKVDQGTATIQIHFDSDGVENDQDTAFATSLGCDSTHAGQSTSTFGGTHTGLPTVLSTRWVDLEILSMTGSPGQISVVLDEV